MSDYVIWDVSTEQWRDLDDVFITQEWPDGDIFTREGAAMLDAIIAEIDASPPPTLEYLLALAEGPL